MFSLLLVAVLRCYLAAAGSKRQSFCGLARFRRCIFPALSAVPANAATGDSSRSLVAPLSCELKQHHEQVDEIEVEHQSSDDRLFCRDVGGINCQIYLLDALRVVGGGVP